MSTTPPPLKAACEVLLDYLENPPPTDAPDPTIEQLAQRAYEAYRKQFLSARQEYVVIWDDLLPSEQAGWIAATSQVWDDAVAML